MRRGILGGTFDPPHLAHLVAGEAAYRQLGLDVVSYVPAGSPWQKAGSDVTSAEHRWAMTELAVAGIDYFEADDREIHRKGWTYTIDTLLSYPIEEELVLILGADAAAGLHTWHRPEAIVTRAGIAVAPRPGTPARAATTGAGTDEVMHLEGPAIELSGTALRAMAGAGRSLRFLVPNAVWSYIEEHGLYGGR